MQCPFRGHNPGQPPTDLPLHAEPASGARAGQVSQAGRRHPHGHERILR